MDRTISLTVGTTGAQGYMQTFMDISELARNMVETHEYVSVSASVVGAPSDEPDCSCEKLHYDDQTIKRVFEAIKTVLPHWMSADDAHQVANEVLLNLQNCGILFRECANPASQQLLLPMSHR